MKNHKKALKAAFPHTIPVMAGFLFLGMAYGILMGTKGYGVGWAVLFSLVAYAGSAQYVAITFLTTAFNPVYALLMSLMVNARHLFYGISMFEKYRDMGKIKPYLIFGLCDETFSIVCATTPPKEVDFKWFAFFVTLLHHVYWVTGTAMGGLLGSMITFNTKGLEFVLTALFVTIFVGQWKSQRDHQPAITGLLCSLLCLILVGKSTFIIPSMVAILLVLTGLRKGYEKRNPSGEGDLR